MKKSHLIVVGAGIIGIVIMLFLLNFLLSNKSNNTVYKNGIVKTESAFLSSQVNNEGAVTVTVTPINQTNWSFKVTLSTHSVDIDEDLTQVSVLLDGRGNEYKPIMWEGDPPGGHHREGVLRFGEITPASNSITLLVRKVGGIDERKFKWITTY